MSVDRGIMHSCLRLRSDCRDDEKGKFGFTSNDRILFVHKIQDELKEQKRVASDLMTMKMIGFSK